MLELKDVSLTFNRGTVNEKQALCGVNLKVDDGDFVTVLRRSKNISGRNISPGCFRIRYREPPRG